MAFVHSQDSSATSGVGETVLQPSYSMPPPPKYEELHLDSSMEQASSCQKQTTVNSTNENLSPAKQQAPVPNTAGQLVGSLDDLPKYENCLSQI